MEIMRVSSEYVGLVRGLCLISMYRFGIMRVMLGIGGSGKGKGRPHRGIGGQGGCNSARLG